MEEKKDVLIFRTKIMVKKSGRTRSFYTTIPAIFFREIEWKCVEWYIENGKVVGVLSNEC